MRLILIALAALSITTAASSASAQETPTFEPFYVGIPNHAKFIAACLDKASAHRVLAEQKTNGSASAREPFALSGVCFEMTADFIAIRVGGAQHLFIIIEAPLL